MKLIKVVPSDVKEKRLSAFFVVDGKGKKVNFGLKGGSTYIDHKDKDKRDAYIARHRVRENFDDPLTAGSLSKWLLWGPHTTLRENLAFFKKKFNL